MSLVLKILLFAFILFGFGSYAKFLMTGKTPSIPEMPTAIPDVNLANITDKISENFSGKEEPAQSYLYKWRDEEGIIYYTSDKPPTTVTDFETIVIHSETNVVPSVPVTDEDREVANTPSPGPLSTELPDNVYSVDGVKHVIDQAKSIQSLVDDQFKQTEVITNKD